MTGFKIFAFVFSLSILCSITAAQEKMINIPLNDTKTIQESKGTRVLILGATEVWASDNKIDSVLWTLKTIPEGGLEKVKLNVILIDNETGQPHLVPWRHS